MSLGMCVLRRVIRLLSFARYSVSWGWDSKTTVRLMECLSKLYRKGVFDVGWVLPISLAILQFLFRDGLEQRINQQFSQEKVRHIKNMDDPSGDIALTFLPICSAFIDFQALALISINIAFQEHHSHKCLKMYFQRRLTGGKPKNVKFLYPQTISPHLFCIICNNVFEDPVLACCGHTFCYTCIANYSSVSQKCPKCKKRTLRTRPYEKNLMALSLVDDLPVQCLHRSCTWKGVYSVLKKHQRICEHKPRNNVDKDMAVAVDVEFPFADQQCARERRAKKIFVDLPLMMSEETDRSATFVIRSTIQNDITQEKPTVY